MRSHSRANIISEKRAIAFTEDSWFIYGGKESNIHSGQYWYPSINALVSGTRLNTGKV